MVEDEKRKRVINSPPSFLDKPQINRVVALVEVGWQDRRVRHHDGEDFGAERVVGFFAAPLHAAWTGNAFARRSRVQQPRFDQAAGLFFWMLRWDKRQRWGGADDDVHA